MGMFREGTGMVVVGRGQERRVGQEQKEKEI
jgi:hypothetical protein